MQHVCGEGDLYTGVLREKPDVNRLLERPRRGMENNIKVDLQEVGWKHGLD